MKVLVIVPTYNERENIEVLVRAVLGPARENDISILVVDDSSPDGTGDIVRALMLDPMNERRLFLIQRASKGGLGGAYVFGFRWGLDRDFDAFVEMDADLSHDPQCLPKLIDALGRYDFVVGSRYVKGGSIVGWAPMRALVSRTGSFAAQTLLGLKIRDMTGGFNAWNRSVIEKTPIRQIMTVGYGFQIEMKYRAARAGFTWHEVPIRFKDRARGESKMSVRIALEALRCLFLLPRRVDHALPDPG